MVFALPCHLPLADNIHSHKHSKFSSIFPIYLYEKWQEEVPDETTVEETPAAAEEIPASSETPAAEETISETDEAPEASETPAVEIDEDEVVVEDITKEDEKVELPPPKMVNVTKEQWSHLNAQPPLWARDPKNITDGQRLIYATVRCN